MLSETERSSLSWYTLPMRIILNPAITVHCPQSKKSMSFSNRLMIPHWFRDQMVWLRNTKLKHVCIIEVVCTDDAPDSLLRAYVKKMCTYTSLLHALWKAFPQNVVQQQNYVIVEHIKLLAKLLDYFLRSNKSNINQYTRNHQWTTMATATHGARNEFASAGQDNTEMHHSEY